MGISASGEKQTGQRVLFSTPGMIHKSGHNEGSYVVGSSRIRVNWVYFAWLQEAHRLVILHSVQFPMDIRRFNESGGQGACSNMLCAHTCSH